MSPSTKCGQCGSEGLRLAFFCGYGSTQHSSCQYMGTWGLTKTELSRLDEHHRRHLRQIIGIRWPHRISNDALYRRTHSSPISAAIRAARWSLFGHVLRLPLDAPVQRAIDAYLEDTGTPKFRGRPRCTLPTTLAENLRRIGRQLRNSDDIIAWGNTVSLGWVDAPCILASHNNHTSYTDTLTHQHTNTPTHQHTNTPTHQHPVGMGQHFQSGLGGCPVHTSRTQQPHTNTPTHQHPVVMGQHFQFGLGGCPVHTSITQQQHTNTPTPGRHEATLSVWAGWKAQASWDTHPHLSTYTHNTTTCVTSNHTTAIQQPNTDTPRKLSRRITPFSLV